MRAFVCVEARVPGLVRSDKAAGGVWHALSADREPRGEERSSELVGQG